MCTSSKIPGFPKMEDSGSVGNKGLGSEEQNKFSKNKLSAVGIEPEILELLLCTSCITLSCIPALPYVSLHCQHYQIHLFYRENAIVFSCRLAVTHFQRRPSVLPLGPIILRFPLTHMIHFTFQVNAFSPN